MTVADWPTWATRTPRNVVIVELVPGGTVTWLGELSVMDPAVTDALADDAVCQWVGHDAWLEFSDNCGRCGATL